VKGKTKNRSIIGPLKNKQGKIASGEEEMAEILNVYFASVFTDEGSGEVPDEEAMDYVTGLSDVEITVEKIEAKIKKLRPSSAPGPDKIGPGLLQQLQTEISPILAIIFKKTLEFGTVPEDWKTANVTPIFKKGSKSEPGNYRPVSLTSPSVLDLGVLQNT
jgi:hypothetical protein